MVFYGLRDSNAVAFCLAVSQLEDTEESGRARHGLGDEAQFAKELEPGLVGDSLLASKGFEEVS